MAEQTGRGAGRLSRRAMLAASSASLLLPRIAAAQARTGESPAPDTEWRTYGGDLANTRYSPLDQIGPANFNDLEVAWRLKTDMFGPRPEYQLECTPLLIKGRLFATVGSRRSVVSLDAATGEVLWVHRMDEGQRALNAPRQLSGRGVGYWTDGKEERILYVTIGYQLVALDAKTGAPSKGFGKDGVVDLKLNNDQDLDLLTADIGLHSAPTIARDVVIIGAAHTAGSIPKTHLNARGYVRGFDVRTGKRLWIFHTIPRKGEFGYDTWLNNSADNAGNGGVWAQIAADEELGLAYLPVELGTGDMMGMFRPGNALFGESLVAVDIKTGKRKWHYQFVHHGVWDFDVPCAAILCDIPHEGKIIKALAQPTKQNWLYVLNRETGEPLWPIVERPVPAGDVPGEWYAPTQPFVSKPPAYDRQGVLEDDLIDFTPALKAQALELVKNYKIGPLFTPPSLSTLEGTYGTLTMPSLQGGANWPGGSYDPETHKVYVYSKSQIALLGLVPVADPKVSDYPYVIGVAGVAPQVAQAMGAPSGANGAAPAAAQRAAAPPAPVRPGPRPGVLTVDGLPLVKPPYGRITAIDLTKGDIAWQVAHGETPDAVKNHPALKGLTIPRTGQAANLGTLTTKTLVICGDGGFFTDETGTRGARLRAYDKATGEERGAVFMPAPQSGSPMTYMLGGRQYLVVAVSGGAVSGELIAYRLPRGA